MDTPKHYDVLVYSAHPDDAEMAMGGTLIKLVRAGFRVLHCAMTKAENSTYGDVATRLEEFAEASRLIGCDHTVLDFPDQEIENTPEARKVIAKQIRTHKPRIVFAPYHTNNQGELGGIANVDHYSTGTLVRDSVKLARLGKVVPETSPHTVHKIYFYLLPSQVRASIVVDVSAEIDDIFEVIRAYRTQTQMIHLNIPIEDRFKVERAAVGHQAGVAYGEGFVTDMKLVFSPESFFKV